VTPHAVGFQVSAATLGSSLVPSLTGVLVGHLGLSAIGLLIVVASAALLVVHESMLRMRPPRPTPAIHLSV
ncbi:MAG TPA: hypothetical protein VFQ61_03460, partial [Polyangiaceae bacterium]|nr:hypothetical protein [Polyangiaceae bacterium]